MSARWTRKGFFREWLLPLLNRSARRQTRFLRYRCGSSSAERGAPGRLLAAGVEHALDVVALHLAAELALAPGHAEAQARAGELHLLERHLAAVELRAA